MISLEIDDYCQDCDMFEAEEHRLVTEDFSCERHVHTTVRCKYDGRCRRIYNFLKGEMKGDNNNDGRCRRIYDFLKGETKNDLNKSK